MKLHFLIGAMMAAIIAAIITPSALAGPDPGNRYFLVKTMEEAQSIKPGTHIAMRCGKCGAVTTMIADKERSYLHNFTCPCCHQKFVVRQDAHGGQHAEYICEDDSGHRADLLKAQ